MQAARGVVVERVEEAKYFPLFASGGEPDVFPAQSVATICRSTSSRSKPLISTSTVPSPSCRMNEEHALRGPKPRSALGAGLGVHSSA